jgi:hypothetical protein
MEFLPEKLVKEWSWRVDNGMPDFRNPLHLVELKNLLIERRFPHQFIDALLSELHFKNQKAFQKYLSDLKGGQVRSTTKVTFDDGTETTAGELTGDKKKKEDDNIVKMTTKEKGLLKKLESKEELTKKEKLAITELRTKRDHEKADTALHMQQAEYDKMKDKHKALKKLGKKRTPAQEKEFKKLEEGGIGAGQEKSQAGEAITHKALRMRKEGKSYKQIQDYLNKVVSDTGSVLYKKDTFGDGWVGAGIAVAKKLENEFGIDNIDTISWDTPEGRKAIGVSTDFNTASDMFIKTTDGKKVGISLKKDGKVFINNGGWAKQHGLIEEALKGILGAESDEVKEFVKESGPGSYQDDYDKAQSKGANKVLKELIQTDIFEDELSPIFDSIKNEKEAKRVFGPSWRNYVDRIGDNPKAWLDRLVKGRGLKGGGFSNDDTKAFVKMLQKSKLGEMYPDIYQDMRAADHNLSKRTMEVLEKNDKLLDAVKKHILNSIHLDEILGINKRQSGDVDAFITAYGIEPDGVFMDEKTLGKLFGPKFQSLLAEWIDEVKANKKSPDDLKKHISDNIVIDYKNNIINFKQEFANDKGEMEESLYPLWLWKARAKGLGSAPAMELGQDPFLAKALQEGSPDVRKWHPKTHYDYLTGKITSTKNEIKEMKDNDPLIDTSKKEKEIDEYQTHKKSLKKHKDFKLSREEWKNRQQKGDIRKPPEGEFGSPDLGPDDFERQVPI